MDNALDYELHDVIIIGAGVSGLRAAGVLANADVNILVLEASNRLGGRVKTDPQLGDLGATWFHGTYGNTAYDLSTMPSPTAAAENGDHPPMEDERRGDADWMCHPAVQYLGAQDLVRVHVDGTRELIPRHAIHPALRVLARGSYSVEGTKYDVNVSVRAALLANIREQSHPLQRKLFNIWESFEASVHGSANGTYIVSAAHCSDYINLPGDHAPPPDGMTCALVTPLVDAVPERALRMGVHVRALHSDKCGVSVFLRGVKKPLRSRVVIWTPSVNVLRDWDRRGAFVPMLSERKRSAISCTGMGAVAKVIALLSIQPVASAGDAFAVMWDKGVAAEFAPWAAGVHAVIVMKEPARACMWLTGKHARVFESIAHDVRITQMRKVLSCVLGEDIVVRRTVCGMWMSDPLVRGGYSYPRVGAGADRVEELACPVVIDGMLRIAFAGEATHSRFYSTLHGAVESGEREARRCIRFLRGEEWRDVGDKERAGGT